MTGAGGSAAVPARPEVGLFPISGTGGSAAVEAGQV